MGRPRLRSQVVTADRYAGSGDDLLAPASDGAAVTPNDNTDLAVASKRLWIGGAGNVALITVKGTTLTYTAVPAGTYLMVRASRVKSTGTTASNIVAEY
jgi:hypothetical protein